MTASRPTPTWVVLLVAGLATTGLVAFLRPGGSDLPDRGATAMEAPDDGYWTSPLRRAAGTGRQDAFDEGLALSLALPENAVGRLALSVGLPADDARFAGSALALFAMIACALRAGGRATLALAALLLSTPILGHTRSDLGEGTAFGLVACFGLALSRDRLALAAFCAGVGLFQKACGWPLGLGAVVAALSSAARPRRLLAVAGGASAGIVVCIAIAVLGFGDDPVAFLMRPFVATRATSPGIDAVSFVLRAAMPLSFDVGPRLVLGAVAGVALVRARAASPALVVAFLAGHAFCALFPDPWRTLPVWCLLPSLVAGRRDGAPPERPPERPPASLGARLASRCLDLYLLLQVCAVGAVVGLGASASTLAARAATVALALVCDATLAWLRRWRPRVEAWTRWTTTSAIAGVALVASAPALASLGDGGDERGAFAHRVAQALPGDAHLVAYSFVATSFHGTLYYPPFTALWEDELVAGPTTLYRLRSATATAAPPKGYAVETTRPMGAVRYGRSPDPSDVVLDTLRRRGR